jgi:hypothetical protein
VEGSEGGFGGAARRLHHRLTDGGPTRGRKILVWSMVGLATLIIFVSSLTIWVQRQVLNTDNWVDLSGQLLKDDDVRELLANRIVDSLYSQNEVQQSIEQRLPGPLDRLAAPVSGLVRTAAVNAADNLLQQPRVQQLWENANRTTHEQLVRLLREEEGRGVVTADNGQVTLNLNELVRQLAQQMGLNVTLPADVGVYVIADSDQLSAAQTAVQVIDPISILALIAVFVLYILAVYLATGFRRETLRGIGAAVLLVGLLLLVLRRLIGNAVIAEVTDPTTEPAGNAVWVLGTNLLRDIAIALVAYGIVLILGAWLAGPSRPATWLRSKAAPVLRQRPIVAYGAVALIFLLVLLWGPTDATREVWGVLVLAVLTGLGVWFLRKQILKEFPASAGA